jgi:hypothetical protein
MYDVRLIVFFISFNFIHSLAAVGPNQEFSQFRHGHLQSTTGTFLTGRGLKGV